MSDIIFNEEKDFEEAVIKALIEHGWESDVIRYPSEEDLIQNWANILFNNNKQGTRLNDQPLTSGEMAQILDHRSTFGDMLADIKNTFKNALIFGFTGTPIQDLNAKKDSTTPTIFGDEIHRYTLGDGIRDKNVILYGLGDL